MAQEFNIKNGVVITTIPTLDNTTTQILTRDTTTGVVKYSDSTSPNIVNYGMVYAMTNFVYLT